MIFFFKMLLNDLKKLKPIKKYIESGLSFEGCQEVIGYFDNLYEINYSQLYAIKDHVAYYEYLLYEIRILERFEFLIPYARFYIQKNDFYGIDKINQINEIYKKISEGEKLDYKKLYLKKSELESFLLKTNNDNFLFFLKFYDNSAKKRIEEFPFEKFILILQNTNDIKHLFASPFQKYIFIWPFHFKCKYFKKIKEENKELANIYFLRQIRCQSFGIKQITLTYKEIELKKIKIFRPVNIMILLLCLNRCGVKLYKWLRIEICKYF